MGIIFNFQISHGIFFLPWEIFSPMGEKNPMGELNSHGNLKISHGNHQIPMGIIKIPWEFKISHGNLKFPMGNLFLKVIFSPARYVTGNLKVDFGYVKHGLQVGIYGFLKYCV